MLRISLSEQGWINVDRTASRVRGEVLKVVQDMQTTLECDEVVALCGRLGICSAGFMFLDRFTRMTRFFSTTPEPSPTYKTPYISRSPLISEALSDELHILFVHIREQQSNWLDREDSVVPEYLRYLPAADYCIVQEETPLREQYGIHYCSYGEMVVTTFLWRALSAASGAGRSDEPFESILPLPFDFISPQEPSLRWGPEELFDKIDVFVATRGGPALLRDVWGKKIRPGITWRDEWPALRLDHEMNQHSEASRRAGLTFCRALAADDTGKSAVGLAIDDETINRSYSAALMPLLQALGCRAKPATVRDALRALEAFARFPVPPFYVWNALERDPKVYCVVPVWSSQGYPIVHNEREYNHFGLALTGLSPMRKIDWTWPADLPEAECQWPVNTDPLIVTSLLRLMARPLVEHSLYGRLVKFAEETTKEELGDNAKAVLDSMTKSFRRRQRVPRPTNS